MAKRRWTVVFVPHGSEPSRIVEVSYGVHEELAVGGVGAGLAAACSSATPPWRAPLICRGPPAPQENARLAQEIGELHGRLATLSDTLTRISQRDAKIRVLANLEPIDPQVQAAGIGGPDARAPSGLPPKARRSGSRRRSGSISTR